MKIRSSFIKKVFGGTLLVVLLAVMAGCGGSGGITGGSTVISGTSVGSATLSWAAPTTKMDGSALYIGDIAGFKVHYGTESGNYTNTVDTGFALNYTIDNLSSGTTYYFAITCYDINGNESGFSAEVSKTI